MKILLLILLTSQLAFSQLKIIHNSNGSVDWHFPTEAEAEVFKQKILFQDKKVVALDSAINYSYKPALETAKLRIDTLHYAIGKLNDIVKRDSVQNSYILGEYINQNTQSKPLIEWIGFYTGIESGYFFADSVISKETILNSVWNNISITGTGYFRIKDFLLSGGISIPLKGKFGITAGIKYRIF